MTAGDILTAGRAGVEVPRQLTAGLFIAPDSGGDECVWCDDPDRPGWPEHLVWRGQVGERVWAVLAAVLPVRSEA